MCDVSSSIQCRHRLVNEATNSRQKQTDKMEPFINLEELDFADDLALLAHIHADIQEKINRLKIYAKQVDLNISKSSENQRDPGKVDAQRSLGEEQWKKRKQLWDSHGAP
ncbi:hypothetical protein ElyMa_004199700 [Elysia marginata]|uniref:Reverse transcriptase domain-containing protein n=1 Tax=Elysia marginata TaxID=1093978 RepID=A0AAV4GNK9_9GAST|nr:hypothetical protein ElyMa_004199700 [Elysia marginata]